MDGTGRDANPLSGWTAMKSDHEEERYAMDELGSDLRHSDDANLRRAPFLFMAEGELTSAFRSGFVRGTTDV
ncbi:hypothetical protein ACP70R_000224 [Stipagrostis hirtigluma subsp. patula]